MTIHVLGISGSLRKGSYNTALLRAANVLKPEAMTLETFDLSPIPLYNADVEASGAPASVLAFKERIAAADALLIATPEYNYSVPGVLKNAIDWASRPVQTSPFNNKPAAIMGAGMRMGTTRAQHHLRQVGTFLNLRMVNQPEVAVIISGSFDEQGNLINADSRMLIKTLLQNLYDWTIKLKG